MPPPTCPHPILSGASATSNIPTPHPVRCQCHFQHSHTPSCQMPVPLSTFPHPILSDASATFNIPTPHPVRCQCHLQHSHTPSCQVPVPPPTFPHPILSDASASSNIPTSDPVRCQCHLRHSSHPILLDASAISDIPHIRSCQMPVPLPTFSTPHPVRLLFVNRLFPPPSNLHPRPHPLSQPMMTAVTETGWS